MTTEEKLEHFYEISIESAQTDANNLIANHTAALNKTLEEHKETKKRQAEAELKAESDKLKRDFNKDISARQLEIKRKTSAITSELREQLFAEVGEKLAAFRQTPEYLTMLTKQIKDAFAFADGDELTVYLDAGDAPLIDKLAKACGIRGLKPEIADTALLGGMQAVIHSKSILIDNSFLTLMKDEKEKFNLEV